MSGNLYVVSGPSGAGKGTLLAQALKGRDDVWLSVSATTRSAREGEQNGREYYFLTPEEFQRLIAEDGLLEWAFVHGNYYGTLKDEVLKRRAEGSDIILEIEPQGAFQVQAKHPEALLIFIEPPSLGELEERLRKRGSETDEQIAARLRHAELEMALRDRYTVVIVNDDLETAAQALKTVFEGSMRGGSMRL
ncbi:MAG: guanylate kinase [Coriobacteriales bacterium]|jgi:guanylate kinase|nr:guanylate kinase [Coriobacteriales bacterium]